jgi:prevent-host-death family protein
MDTMTAFEAKTRFGELLERVGRGEEIVITRHDKAVARVVPEGRRSREQVRKAVDALSQLRIRIGNRSKDEATLSEVEVRSAIEEGRRSWTA